MAYKIKKKKQKKSKTTLIINFNTELKDEDIETVRETVEDTLGVEILSIDERN